MSKWARVTYEKVDEITDIDPKGRYHPSLIWVPCGDEITTEYRYTKAAGFFLPEPMSEPVQTVEALPSPEDRLQELESELAAVKSGMARQLAEVQALSKKMAVSEKTVKG